MFPLYILFIQIVYALLMMTGSFICDVLFTVYGYCSNFRKHETWFDTPNNCILGPSCNMLLWMNIKWSNWVKFHRNFLRAIHHFMKCTVSHCVIYISLTVPAGWTIRIPGYITRWSMSYVSRLSVSKSRGNDTDQVLVQTG